MQEVCEAMSEKLPEIEQQQKSPAITMNRKQRRDAIRKVRRENYHAAQYTRKRR